MEMRTRTGVLWLLAIFQLWLAHAFCYLLHEYAHSFLAWLLHYKTSPLALDYGHVNLDNLVFQADIDENVDYGPIFAAGHGSLAALIAVAGVLIGNGVSYLLGRSLFATARARNSRGWAMLFFWVCVMSVGNFLSYVPVRTFATHADMATTTRGLGVSAWWIALALGVPFALAIWHLFARILPDAEAFLFRDEPIVPGAFILLTTYLIFVFFGGAGIRNYGSASHWVSVVCEYVLFPVVTVVCLQQATGTSARKAR
jgi:hypothetical protein